MGDKNVYLRFLVPMRPISVNRMYRNFRGRTIKSAEGRKFETDFNNYLAEFATHAIDFLNMFDPSADAVHVEVVCYIQHCDFFTKGGKIHKRCLDVDNALKSTVDQVFRFIGLDDALITRISCSKVPSEADSVEVILRRVNAPSRILNPEPRAMLGGDSLQ